MFMMDKGKKRQTMISRAVNESEINEDGDKTPMISRDISTKTIVKRLSHLINLLQDQEEDDERRRQVMITRSMRDRIHRKSIGELVKKSRETYDNKGTISKDILK